MKLLLLAPSGYDVAALAEGIANTAKLPLFDQVAAVEGKKRTEEGFILNCGPLDVATARILDTRLETLSSPLDLVLLLELPPADQAPQSTIPPAELTAVVEYYRTLGLLRRLRIEADLEDQVHAALRIMHTLEFAHTPPPADAFSMALPPAPQEDSAHLPAAGEAHLATHSLPISASDWKTTAAEKGRLRRRPLRRRSGDGRKPRR